MAMVEESKLECECGIILIENDIKVFSYPPLKDKIGAYIPFCDFHCHRGILTRRSEKKCQSRNCEHYKIFRLSSEKICL